MFRGIARKPKAFTENYMKYGFIVTEHEGYACPRCRSKLNAGPNYQPKYCDQCGQKVTFKGITWKTDKELRMLPAVKRGVVNE